MTVEENHDRCGGTKIMHVKKINPRFFTIVCIRQTKLDDVKHFSKSPSQSQVAQRDQSRAFLEKQCPWWEIPSTQWRWQPSISAASTKHQRKRWCHSPKTWLIDVRCRKQNWFTAPAFCLKWGRTRLREDEPTDWELLFHDLWNKQEQKLNLVWLFKIIDCIPTLKKISDKNVITEIVMIELVLFTGCKLCYY